jgi:hypothetical protein
LGIDLKKTDNAEAQREKEKMTLFMRSAIVAEIKEALNKLAELALVCDDIMNGRVVGDYNVKAGFAEYAEPTFESRAGTVSDLYAKGLMSVEMAVDRLYGKNLSDKEKDAEVQRIKSQSTTELDYNIGGELDG